VPAELQDSRFGIAAFQHPEIVEKVQETTPEIKLLELIDAGLWFGEINPESWDGTAAELEKKLVRENSQVSYEARRLLHWSNATGTYLARLRDSRAEQARGRVRSRKVNGATVWTIDSAAREAAPAVVAVPAALTATLPSLPPTLPAGLREKVK
jgi:hypothetical protein